nr:nuclear transcription factor y subunit b-1 [Quercus suber]
MSQSPPRDTEDVEPAPPSPDENDPQPPEGMSRPDDAGDHALGYDFEVKEQDRWLPIANGESSPPMLSRPQHVLAPTSLALIRCSLCFDACMSYPRGPSRVPDPPAYNRAFARLSCTVRRMGGSSTCLRPAASLPRGQDHEDRTAGECEDRQGGQGVHARMRERIHLVHHERRFVRPVTLHVALKQRADPLPTASEKCQQEKRKTVNGEDILFAMTSLGFENYGEALKIYLARYRENLVTRGDQKPLAGGSGSNPNTTLPSYDANHNALSNPMESGTEGNGEFTYGVGHTDGQY